MEGSKTLQSTVLFHDEQSSVRHDSTHSTIDGIPEKSTGLPRPVTAGLPSFRNPLTFKFFKRKASQFTFSKRYDGHLGYILPEAKVFRAPKRPNSDGEKVVGNDPEEDDNEFTYLNRLRQSSQKSHDVAVYLSPTRYEPRRLMVQCTEEIWRDENHFGDWRRTKMKGSVPLALKIAEFALRPSDKRVKEDPNDPLNLEGRKAKRSFYGVVDTFFRIMLVGIPLQALLALPGMTLPWDVTDVIDQYIDYPGYHWQWPKYAINPLDMKPSMRDDDLEKEKTEFKYLSKPRLIRPRNLVVFKRDADGQGHWKLEESTISVRYILLSYTRVHFNTDKGNPEYLAVREVLEKRAEEITLNYFRYDNSAIGYWLDYKCGPDTIDDTRGFELLNADVNRISDVIRSADKVIVLVPDATDEHKKVWGARMWTLPEGLLSRGNVEFTWPSGDGFDSVDLTKVEMTGRVWTDPDDSPDDGQPTRLLAEHYQLGSNLSRLEFFTLVLAALEQRKRKIVNADLIDLTRSDRRLESELAYAIMGFVPYRIEQDNNDTLFQALAKISLANDNDNLIERMICLYPDLSRRDDRNPEHDLFKDYKLNRADQFRTHIWDITPTCEVVGVGEDDNTVMLDGCRAIAIRWKDFPRMEYKRSSSFKKKLAEYFLRSGIYWLLLAISTAWYFIPLYLTMSLYPDQDQDQDNESGDWYTDVAFAYTVFSVIGCFAISAILAFFAPYSVRRLFGGSVLESTARLVAFEGTMTRKHLERQIFGNDRGRLRYEPSSTPFCRYNRHPLERLGTEPDWIADPKLFPYPPIPKGQKVFTMVDTGRLTISIFTAEKPPTVALLCGKEGGMLRVVLCSWDFRNDCLYKEAVMRMPSDIGELAAPKCWLKVCLESRCWFWEKQTDLRPVKEDPKDK